MGNIVPRAGIKAIPLTFWAHMLPLHHVGSLISLLYARLPVYALPWLRGQCRLLHSSHWNCKPFNTYNYVHTGSHFTYTYTQGRYNNHTERSLYRIIIMATSVVCVIKMGNIVPRAGTKPTSLAFQPSVLALHHGSLPDVTTIPTPTCLCITLPQMSMQTTTLDPLEL